MFEVGDIVKFRNWSNQLWIEGSWIIIDSISNIAYDDNFRKYEIQNQETGEIESEVNWQQIEHL